MTGKFLQMLIKACSVQRFDRGTSPFVEQFPPFNQDGVVRYFLSKRRTG